MRRKRTVFTPEMHEYFRTHAWGTSYKDMIIQFKEEFGLELTLSQVSSYYKNHGLRNGRPPFGGHCQEGYPKEVTDLILKFAGEGRDTFEAAKLINERLGDGTISRNQVAYWMKNHHVRNGYTGRFRKGFVPYTKGKRWDDFMSKEAQQRSMQNLFPKGNIPHNIALIGEIRVTADGYLVQKVQSYGTQRKRWRFLHRLVWEAHNGPIPPGGMITFADGDRTNCSIENLVLETKAQHAIKNHMGWKSWDRESAETFNLMADLKCAVRRKKRREK